MKKITLTNACFSMNQFLCLLVAMSLNVPSLWAQEKPPVQFGKVTAEDFNLPASVSPDAGAVVIADVGSVNFIGNKDNNWVSYVFKHNIRIKLLDKKAFDLATIKLNIYGNGKRQDKIEDLEASTYNLENGKVIETKLNLADLFRDTLNKNHVEEKFSLPGIKEGCIIEYSYRKSSYRYWALTEWHFQLYDYPCLYSSFEVAIPQMLGYLTFIHGLDSFVVNKAETSKEMYTMQSVNVTAQVKKHKWVMKNIPAFKAEEYLEHPYDYIDGVEFHLLQTYDGDQVSGTTNWKDASNELLSSSEFGAAVNIENTSNLTNTVDKICGNDVDYMVAARHIYGYVRDNFKAETDDDIYLGDNLYVVNRKKKGTVEELNLLLVALLRQKRINASPVILSTTEFGVNPSSYPVMAKINYVVCMMRMGNDTIFLDASKPNLGFGKLPLNCYNGHARIISEQDSGSIFLERDAIKEKKSTTVFIINDEKGNGLMSGSVETTPGYFESYEMRNAISKKGQKDFFKAIKESAGDDMTIENIGIDSLNKSELPLKIHYDFSFTADPKSDIIYYNPIIHGLLSRNLLSSEKRRLPVEMSYPIDDTYILNMEIPNGFVVDELPKSAKVAYNQTEGFYEYLIQKSETNIQLRSHIKLNKASFSPDEYDNLRNFFAYVVKKQSEQIVFRKKK